MKSFFAPKPFNQAFNQVLKHFGLSTLSLILVCASTATPVQAHQGVAHGDALHQRVSGIDVLLEVLSQKQYQQRFGTLSGVSGSHVMVVKLLDHNQPIVKAQIKTQVMGADKKLVGAKDGEALTFFSGTRQHFAKAYQLTKGSYNIKVVFMAAGKSSIASFTAKAQ